MRERGVPTAAELAVWLRIAAPTTARGTLLFTPGPGEQTYGWATFGGPPVIAALPDGEPVAFTYAAPHSWRLDTASGPLGRSDGRRAVAWGERGLEAGAALLVLPGPAALLHPQPPEERRGSPFRFGGRGSGPDDGNRDVDSPDGGAGPRPGWDSGPDDASRDVDSPDGVAGPSDGPGRGSGPDDDRSAPGSGGLETPGPVTADRVADRPCWRWDRGEDVVWVDEQTGCLLRSQSDRGVLELTEVAFDEAVDPAVFALPDDLPAPPPSALPERPVRQEPAPPEPPGFRVPWWPGGCESQPVAGDPDVPEVLSVLLSHREGGPTFWVGVAPAGRLAPVRSRRRYRRWEGDGCSLSLSWSGDVPDAVVDRMVASMPTAW